MSLRNLVALTGERAALGALLVRQPAGAAYLAAAARR